MRLRAFPSESGLDRALKKIVRDAEDLTDADAMLDAVSETMGNALEADARVFVRLDPLSALWIGAVGAGYALETCEHFARRLFLKSPLADYGARALRAERVSIVGAESASRADLYVQHFFGDLAFSEELHATYAVGAQSFGHLTLSRRRGSFHAAAARFVEATLGPVTQALRRLLAKEMLESVPGDGVALLFVDDTGDVTAANERGAGLLSRATKLDPGHTRSALAVILRLAQRQLHAGEPSSEPADVPRLVYVEPETRQRYRLLAERLLGAPGGRPRMLIMAEPVRALDSVELLRTTGLSEREAEVAIVLLRGLKSAEGARTLGISEHTFLSHLKIVYRKLGVGSRGELASLILNGA